MARIWSINPDKVPSIINKDTGEVNFPPNDSNDDKTYTIKYMDSELGIECTKDVVQEGKRCKFRYSPESNISSDGGEITLGTFTEYNIDDLNAATIQVTEDDDNIVNGTLHINVNNHNVTGNIKKNEDSSPKTFKYAIKSGNGSECANVTVTQSKGCDCENLRIDKTYLDWAWNEINPKQVVITADHCVNLDSIIITSSSSWFKAIRNGNTININPIDSTVGAQDATVTVSYAASNNTCSSSITVHQDAEVHTYTCDDFTFSYLPPSNMRIPTNVQLRNLDLLHITGPSYNAITANCRIEISGNMEFSEFDYSTSTSARAVVHLMSADTPSVDTISVRIIDDICKTYEIFRVCPCGNDDCESNLGDYIIDNELVADSWYLGPNGETEFEYEGHPYPYRFLTSDSIFCDYTKVQVMNGETTENSKYLSVSTYITDGGGENLFHIGGWYQDVGDVRVGFKPNDGVGNHGMITYTMLKNNFSTDRKDHKIIFGVEPNTVLLYGSPMYSELWPNATVCQEFTVNIRQAPNGGHYERHDGCGENEYGVAYRKLVPLEGSPYPGEVDKRDDIRRTNHNCLPPPFAKCIDEEHCNT